MKLMGNRIKIISEGFCRKPPVGCFGYATSAIIFDENITILFDTGSYGLRGELIKIVKNYHIDFVVISHLHFDHCSNLDLFISSKTKIIISKKELEYFENFKTTDSDLFSYFDNIKNKLLIQTPNNNQKISKNCKIVFTPGHTNGHISLEVKDGNDTYLFCGDGIKTKMEIIKFPENTNAFDPQTAQKTRLEILSRYKNIILGHDTINYKDLKLRRF